MSKLVEIRIQDAVENIQLVEEALAKAVGRRANSAKAATGLQKFQLSGSIADIDALIKKCKRSLSRPVQFDQQLVDSAENALETLTKEISRFAGPLGAKARTRCDDSIRTTHQKNTSKLLGKKRGSLVKMKFRGAIGISAAEWKKIGDQTPYWGEHIESVAGIVLRDEEFDCGLSVLADELVRWCRKSPMIDVPDTLNILGREKTEVRRDNTKREELEHTVYFRFPTWSIWGLPLAAHDVWLASDKGGVLFQNELTKAALEVWDEPFVQQCLADTYATYVIGPSYACARILLSLNVVHSPQDQMLADVIFSALDFVAALDQDESVVADLLRREWRVAGGGTKYEEMNGGACLLNRDCRAADRLLQAYWVSAGQAAGIAPASRGAETSADTFQAITCPLAVENRCCPVRDGSLLAGMCAALLDFLPRELRYPEDEWLCVGPGLRSYFEDQGPRPSTSGLDIRHVLRAAWLTRIEYMESAEDVASQARKLCHEAVQTRDCGVFGRDENGSDN